MNKKDCYWYSEYKDMNATIPYCRYYKQDECECTYFCDHYISQDGIIIDDLTDIGE